MDEENNQQQQQQTDLDNNPVSQMERKIADKTVEQISDVANNLMAKAKQMAMEALKKLAKLIAKAAMHLFKLLVQLIIYTAPVSLIVIGVIILALIFVAFYLATFGAVSNIFKNDVKAGDVSTSEMGSIYDDSYIIESDNNFTISASDDLIQISEEIHDYIAYYKFWYRNGNIMDYPEILKSQRNDNRCWLCSTNVR